MRSLILFLGFASLGLGFVVLDRATQPKDRSNAASAEAFSLTEWLSSATGLIVNGIVLTPSAGTERDFRGLHSDQGRLRPVYGRVRRVCDGTPITPNCWEISYLEIDGKQIAHTVRSVAVQKHADDAGPAEVIETADSGPVVAPATAWQVVAMALPRQVAFKDNTTDTAIIEPAADASSTGAWDDLGAEKATGHVPVPAARPAGRSEERLTGKAATPRLRAPDPNGPSDDIPTAETSTQAKTPVATHHVDRPVINARTGPGTDNPAIGRLSADLRLSLMKTSQDWGQFLVLDGALKGQVVWVALDILRATP